MRLQTVRKLIPTAALALAAFTGSIWSAAPGITFPDGKFVPKDSIYLFLCIGNSAMSGRDTLPDTTTVAREWKFRISPPDYDWKPAKDPACSDANTSESAPKGGPTIPMVRELGKLNPNVTVCVVQYSASGWAQADHYAYGKDGYDTIVKYAKLLGPNVTIAGIVSMFNLVEVQNCSDAACIGNYSGSIQAMVSSFRNDLKTIDASLANVPYIHAGYPVLAGNGGSGNYLPTTPEGIAMIAEIAKIPGLVPNSVVIPTDSCTICHSCTPLGYYSHYDSYGNHRFGKREADTIAARGWFPSPSATSILEKLTQNRLGYAPAIHQVLFDGSNWSVFGNEGKSFTVYAPSGRAISISSENSLRSRNLLPGIYFVKPDIR